MRSHFVDNPVGSNCMLCTLPIYLIVALIPQIIKAVPLKLMSCPFLHLIISFGLYKSLDLP